VTTEIHFREEGMFVWHDWVSTALHKLFFNWFILKYILIQWNLCRTNLEFGARVLRECYHKNTHEIIV